nr:hypothetical protein [uncultured Psychroserpens sp.]
MKNLLNLGTALNRTEQKAVFGGNQPARLKREGDCDYNHYYAEDCPIYTSNSDGGCWITEVTCGGSN